MSADSARGVAGSTAWLLVANVFRNLGLIALLVLVARYTNPETVGRYSLALAICTPVFVLAEMGLRTVYLTMHDAVRFRWYGLVRLSAGLGALVVSTAIAAVFARGVLVTVVFVAAVKLADSCADIASGPLQHYRQPQLIATAYAGLAVLGSAAVWIALASTGSLEAALVALLAISVGTALLMLALARRPIRRYEIADSMPARTAVRSVISAGLPTGISWALLSLVSTVPQYFLAGSHGQADVGRFAVLLYIVAAVELFMNALTQSWIPQGRLLQQRHAADRGFPRQVARTAGLWSLVLLPLTVTGVLIAATVFPVLFGPAYGITPLEGLAVAACVMSLPAVFFGSMSLSIQNRWNAGLLLGAAAVAVSLAACLVLIPPFGVAGALWATFAAYTARAVVAFAVMRR